MRPFLGSLRQTASTAPITLSNVVIDYVDTGLYFSGQSATLHAVSHLTVNRCQQGVFNHGQNLTLDNSIITACSVAVSTEFSGTTVISYTLLHNNVENFTTKVGSQLIQGPGLLNVDPDFLNFPTSSHLRPDSPAINAAAPQADYSREPGYNGGRADLGAYGNTPQAPQQPPLTQMDVSLSPALQQSMGQPDQVVTGRM